MLHPLAILTAGAAAGALAAALVLRVRRGPSGADAVPPPSAPVPPPPAAEPVEAALHAFFEAAPYPLTLASMDDGRVLYANRRAQELYGIDAGGTAAGAYPGRDDHARLYQSLAEKGMVEGFEMELRGANGADRELLLFARRLEWQGRGCALVAALDISERKRLEAQVRHSEQWFRVLFDYAPDAYYLCDSKAVWVDGNHAAEELSGYAKEELIGRRITHSGMLPASQIPKVLWNMARNLAGKPTGPDEFTVIRKGGERRQVEVRTFPVRIHGRLMVLGIARDLTGRRRIDAQVWKGRAESTELQRLGRIGTFSVDLSDHGLMASAEAARIFGLPPDKADLLAEDLHQAVDPSALAPLLEAWKACLTEAKPAELVLRLRRGSGAAQWVWLQLGAEVGPDGQPLRLHGVVRDVSEQKRSEAESAQLHGLVHGAEVGLLLMVAARGGKAAAWKVVEMNPAFERLCGVGRGTLEAQTLGQALPGLGQAWDQHCAALGAGNQAREPFELLAGGRHLRFAAHAPAAGLLAVSCTDLSGARRAQASAEAQSGLVQAALASQPGTASIVFGLDRKVLMAEGPALASLEQQAGAGVGLPLERLLDQAGLAGTEPACRRALEGRSETQHLNLAGREWSLDCAPVYGAGQLLIGGALFVRQGGPAVHAAAAAHGSPAAAPAQTVTAAPPGGRVLVLDDEPLVLGMLERMLQVLGWQVESCLTPDQALQSWRQALQEGRPFTVAVLDLSLPGPVSGQELLRRLQAFDPQVRAVAASGDLDLAAMADPMAHGFRARLAKPFHMEALDQALKRTLA